MTWYLRESGLYHMQTVRSWHSVHLGVGGPGKVCRRILRASISNANTNTRGLRGQTPLTNASRDFEVIDHETRIHHATFDIIIKNR